MVCVARQVPLVELQHQNKVEQRALPEYSRIVRLEGQIKYIKNFTMRKIFLLKYARNIRVLLPNLVFLAACML